MAYASGWNSVDFQFAANTYVPQWDQVDFSFAPAMQPVGANPSLLRHHGGYIGISGDLSAEIPFSVLPGIATNRVSGHREIELLCNISGDQPPAGVSTPDSSLCTVSWGSNCRLWHPARFRSMPTSQGSVAQQGACSAQIPVLAEIHAAAAGRWFGVCQTSDLLRRTRQSPPPAGRLEARLPIYCDAHGVDGNIRKWHLHDSGVGRDPCCSSWGSASVKIPIYCDARGRGNIGSGCTDSGVGEIHAVVVAGGSASVKIPIYCDAHGVVGISGSGCTDSSACCHLRRSGVSRVVLWRKLRFERRLPPSPDLGRQVPEIPIHCRATGTIPGLRTTLNSLFADMAAFQDDDRGGLPTRFGTPSGSANRRVMLEEVDGAGGIRTRLRASDVDGKRHDATDP